MIPHKYQISKMKIYESDAVPKIEAERETANEVQQPLGIYERFHLSALNDLMVIGILKWNFYYYWE